MTITTKFNVGEKAWVLVGQDFDSVPKEVEIEGIDINVYGKFYKIIYSFRKWEEDRDVVKWNESHFFKTKEELIERLANK